MSAEIHVLETGAKPVPVVAKDKRRVAAPVLSRRLINRMRASGRFDAGADLELELLADWQDREIALRERAGRELVDLDSDVAELRAGLARSRGLTAADRKRLLAAVGRVDAAARSLRERLALLCLLVLVAAAPLLAPDLDMRRVRGHGVRIVKREEAL